MSVPAPVTNGDVVAELLGRGRAAVLEVLGQWRRHPDEAAVIAAPVVVTFALAAKYRMSAADHLLLTELGAQLGVLAVRAYRDWKGRPIGRPAGERF